MQSKTQNREITETKYKRENTWPLKFTVVAWNRHMLGNDVTHLDKRKGGKQKRSTCQN